TAASGTLTDNGIAVVARSEERRVGKECRPLGSTPAAKKNGLAEASFTFQVQDDGGTSNGGVDLDQSPNTMTVNVTSVNDAPAGTSNTVSTLEDTAYHFTAADFAFTSPNTTPPSDLLSVVITTLLTAASGTLTDNGIAVVA